MTEKQSHIWGYLLALNLYQVTKSEPEKEARVAGGDLLQLYCNNDAD